MIDKNGKLFGKVSIIDIVIIIAVIVAGVFFVNKIGLFSNNTTITNSNPNLRVTFYQEEVNSFTANNINIDDPTTETLQNKSFGKVVDIKVGDSVSWAQDKNGNQLKSTKEGWSHVYITMETNGTLGPNGINISGSTYYIGQFITLRVGDSIFYGRIYEASEF